MRLALRHTLLACISLGIAPLRAESDPSDIFFDAFTTAQKAEKLEASGNKKEALKAYQQAINMLDQLRKTAPSWSPPVVEFRRQKTADAVMRLEAQVGKIGGPASRTKPTEDDLIGTLPKSDDAIIPGTESFVPPKEKGTPTRPAARSGNALQDVQKQIEDLQEDLSKTKGRLDLVTREKEDLAKKYDRAIKDSEESAAKQAKLEKRANMLEDALLKQEGDSTKDSESSKQMRAELDGLKKQLRDAQIDRDAEAELRDQIASRLAAANNKIATLAGERDAAKRDSAAVPGKLAAMQKEIDKALQEKGDLTSKLGKVQDQLAKVTGERDEALQQVAKMKEAQKQVDKLMADNTTLMAKLGEAESQVKTFKAQGVEKDKQIATLKADMDGVKKQLVDAKKQGEAYQTQMSELQSKLDLQSKELAQMKSDATTTAADRKRLIDENEVLRGIVVRQMKTQAVRDKTKQLVLTELAKLEVNSKALIDQIEFLGQPVVKLTEREKKLFKQPTIEISDAEISIAAPKEIASAPPVAPEAMTPPPVTVVDKPAVAAGTEPKHEAPMLAEVKPPVEATPPVTPPATPVVETTPPPVPPKMEEKPKPSLTIDTGIAPDAGVPSLDLANTKPTPKTPDKPKAPKTVKGPPPEGELPTKEGETPSTPAAEKTEMASAKTAGPDDKVSVPAPGSTPATTAPGATPGASSAPGTDAVPSGDAGAPAVPAELLTQAREAKEKFDKAEYRDAEKIYEKILTKAPSNLYILSNLGVVRFRAGKLKLAEESFKKAIAIAPEDGFSHCTLGIVYYSQGKYDEAVSELTKALAINPKNATAHNYLGITASQKGWQEAAQKELETATTFDPQYADAHFNLAVVFATQQPPNKEMARKHYKLAIELGAEPDAALEQLIK